VSVPTVRLIDADMFLYGALLKNATSAHRLGRRAHTAAMLKEQRRRDCARRHCGSYRGRSPQRQRLLASPEPGGSCAKRPIRCWWGWISCAAPVMAGSAPVWRFRTPRDWLCSLAGRASEPKLPWDQSVASVVFRFRSSV